MSSRIRGPHPAFLAWRRTFRLALVFAACISVFALAGCGAGPTISDDAALHDLQHAGFTGLTLALDTQVDNRDGEIDTIQQARFARAFLPPVELVHYASDDVAKEHYGMPGPRYVRHLFQGMVAGGHDVVPPRFHFSLRKALSFRICNVILWSYDIEGDPRLARRVHRAARLLRDSCH